MLIVHVDWECTLLLYLLHWIVFPSSLQPSPRGFFYNDQSHAFIHLQVDIHVHVDGEGERHSSDAFQTFDEEFVNLNKSEEISLVKFPSHDYFTTPSLKIREGTTLRGPILKNASGLNPMMLLCTNGIFPQNKTDKELI
jgi:hypothetical protein